MLLVAMATAASAGESDPKQTLSSDEAAEIVHESGDDRMYRLAGIYQYLQFDYLNDANAVNYTFEIENQFQFDSFDVENRLILDYSDYPVEIQDVQGNPFPVNGAGSGVGDLLVGTFFSPKNGLTSCPSKPPLAPPPTGSLVRSISAPPSSASPGSSAVSRS